MNYGLLVLNHWPGFLDESDAEDSHYKESQNGVLRQTYHLSKSLSPSQSGRYTEITGPKTNNHNRRKYALVLDLCFKPYVSLIVLASTKGLLIKCY